MRENYDTFKLELVFFSGQLINMDAIYLYSP